ncbi:MAG: vanadium-dependent haloperoxidase [Ginsengibacter sp.]
MKKLFCVKKTQLRLMLLLIAASFILITGCKKNEPPFSPCDHLAAGDYNPKIMGDETSRFSSEVPEKWYAIIVQISKTIPGHIAGVIARDYGYLGLALYESVVPGMPKYQSLQKQLNELHALPKIECGEKYYYPACANAALANMLRHLFANASTAQNFTIDSLENAFNTQFKSAVADPVYNRSVGFGQAVSNAIYQWSVSDGGDQAYLNLFPSTYVPPVGPQYWTPLPGQAALTPYWGKNRTFIKGVAVNTQPPAPPEYSLNPSSKFYQEELEVYNESINQDPEHAIIGKYWAALGPPTVSISILNSVLFDKNANLAVAAEAYCKVGIATSDAHVSCYITKYKYNQVRPITFIRANFDPVWNPLIPTPPFPDYTSAHSVQTGAVARVLADIFGDNTTFTDYSINGLGFTPRTFTKFSDYANEVGLSRIYAGIHNRTADFIGLAQGDKVGMAVSALKFKKN